MKNKKFAFVGGDFRNKSLTELFLERGSQVKTFALGESDCASIEIACKDSDVIIAPIPFSNDGKVLHTPLHHEKILLSDFFKAIPKKAFLIGGRIDQSISEYARCFDVLVMDVLKREDFSIANAIPTAEGAIAIALQETFVTLNDSQCLVLGYGRIGKVLCQMLKGFGSKVLVASRNVKEKAYAKAFGIDVIEYGLLKEHIKDAKVVINTVPFKIIDKEVLNVMKNDALIIDLASKPGGVDFDEARNRGIRTVWALSLPGKVAKETSAKILRDTIFNILAEREEG